MSTVVSIAAWIGTGVGALLIVRGLMRRSPAQVVFGIAIAAYALPLRIYASLGVSGDGQALSTMDRVWATSGDIVGGWAMMSLLLAIHWSHRTGRPGWTDTGMIKRWAVLSLLAVVSVMAVHLTLRWPGQEPLLPSTDFLNEYGDRANIVLYELIFACWTGVPVGTLGWTTWRFHHGIARWLTTIGCGFSVFWAVWKVIGIGVRYIGDERIAVQSPVSVATSAIALVLVITGLLIGWIGVSLNRLHAWRDYRAALRADDERHYDPDVDSAA